MSVRILTGDVRERLADLPDNHFDCVVTSPPYWGLRNYDCEGQLGLEPTLGEHLAVMVGVFREVRRVLKPTGTCWLNYGDCYAASPNGRSAADTKALGNDDRTFRDKPFSTVGPIQTRSNGGEGQPHDRRGGYLKPKDLCMVPNRIAIALQEDGWWVRSEIIWAKPNPMPESVTDRPATAHEKIWLLTKSARYFYDADGVRQNGSDNSHGGNPNQSGRKQEALGKNYGGALGVPAKTRDKQRGHSRRHAGFNERWDAMSKDEQCADGRNLRNYEPAPVQVWPFALAPFSDAHFATFPPELVVRCLTAGCPAGGTVLDPFGGAGTTGLVADRLGRDCTLIELNPTYSKMAQKRIESDAGLSASVVAQ